MVERDLRLLALLVIPIVIIIVAIILAYLWFTKYKPKEKTNVTLNEMGYVQNVSKFGGTVSKSNRDSTLSMANSNVRNQVYSTMGKNYGFSLENADFSKEDDDDVTAQCENNRKDDKSRNDDISYNDKNSDNGNNKNENDDNNSN